jgi:hypothetical protein
MKLEHAIKFKFPKFLDSRINKLTPEEKEKFGTIAATVGIGLLGLTVIYLTGYNRGIKKSIDNRGIYIIKSGDN